MSGRFVTLRRAVVARLSEVLAPIPVERHFGPFDIGDLKVLGARAPVVKLSIVGPSGTRPRAGGDREADLMIAAYVVTKQAPAAEADDLALDISENIAARIHKQTFGLKFVEPPVDVVIDNHYSGKLRELAGTTVALFSVSWQQLVIFGEASVPPLSELVVPDPTPAFEVTIDGVPAGGEVLA